MTDQIGHIIAVDGGGSTCRVAVATPEGRVIATKVGPPANVTTSLKSATATIRETVLSVWQAAALPADELIYATAYLGLAGVKNPTIARAVANDFPATHVTVVEDRATTMAGALGEDDGFVGAIGTGSFLGRQTGTSQTFIGGWGLQLGDQASGAWLGRQMLSSVLEWQDGLREGSDLLQATLHDFSDNPSAIVTFATAASPQDFAKHAPPLLDAADTGDAAAVEIIRNATAYLQGALNSLGFRNGDRLCLTGGIGARYGPFLDPIYAKTLIAPLGSALDGAIRLAMASHAARQDL